MSVETTTRKSTQTMTILLTEYDFTFRALIGSPTDIKCIRHNTATGLDDDMTYITTMPAPSTATDVLKYLVDINDDGVGGTITVAWPSTGCTITIYRETTDIQSSDYEDYNQFPADTVESDLDKRTMVTQELDETVDRSLKVPITSTADTELPTVEGGKYLGWNAGGTALENKTVDATPSGTTAMLYLSNYASYAAAIAAIGSTESVLVLDTAGAVAANTTTPATLEQVFTKKGVLTIAAGVTLTINGPIDAGLYQIFAGDGSLSLGSLAKSVFSPMHLGLVVDSAAAASANVSAINDTLSYASICKLPAGTIYIDDTINVNASYQGIEGEGRSNTILFASETFSTTAMIKVYGAGGVGFVTLKDFAVDGDDKADYGIKYGESTSCQVDSYNLYVRECLVANIWMYKTVGCNFYDLWTESSGGHGIAHYWADGQGTNINNFFGGRALYNGDCGIYLSGKTNGLNLYGMWFEANQNQGILIDMASATAATNIKLININECYFEADNMVEAAGGSHIKSYLNGGTYYPAKISIKGCTFGGIRSSANSYLIDLCGKDICLQGNSYDWDVFKTINISESSSHGIIVGDQYAIDGTDTTLTGSSIGNIQIIDGLQAAWADYSSSSLVTGWTGALITEKIYYKKVGKTVNVSFWLSGTSSTTSIRFTLPYTAANTTVSYGGVLELAVDNGSNITTACRMNLNANNNYVQCYTNMSDGVWTNSGTKSVRGSFWYEAT